MAKRSNHWNKQRKKIIASAIRLFSKKGYEGTPLRDIASATHLTSAAIYHYFPSKQSLFTGMMEGVNEEIIRRVAEIAESNLSAEKKLEEMTIFHVTNALENLNYTRLRDNQSWNLPPKLRKYMVQRRDRYEELFRKVIKEGMDMGKFAPGDVKLTSLFVLGFLNSIPAWYKSNGELSSAQIASKSFAVVSSVLKTPTLRA